MSVLHGSNTAFETSVCSNYSRDDVKNNKDLIAAPKRNKLRKFLTKSSKSRKNTSKNKQLSSDTMMKEERMSLKGENITRGDLEEIAWVRYSLGRLSLKEENYDQAQNFFEDALRARLLLLGDDHEDVMKAHEALGRIAKLQGDNKKADFHFKIVEEDVIKLNNNEAVFCSFMDAIAYITKAFDSIEQR
eukprot:CAMPEP_0185728798 /NCGR_PEP_ID=MMETSP1171-20130828/4195_1 /TAXON_ID=374046 /ORGANISM="Helicotheca tamensis, Strain CCMP826" /LENGTH=188 /DNA_ID=CAMNT_0028397541 /DNA_START=82 /DNA_END=649 /DNA_ORIENTATION=-